LESTTVKPSNAAYSTPTDVKAPYVDIKPINTVNAISVWKISISIEV
jgi:hypothetical protein